MCTGIAIFFFVKVSFLKHPNAHPASPARPEANYLFHQLGLSNPWSKLVAPGEGCADADAGTNFDVDINADADAG